MIDNNQLQNEWPIAILKCIIVAVVAGCIALTFVVAQNEKEFLLSILGTMCLVVVSFPLFVRRGISVFEPLVFIVILVVIGTPMKLIYVLWFRGADEYIANHILLHQEPQVFLTGVIVCLVGWICFVIGYMLRFPKAPLAPIFFPHINEWNGRKLQLALLAIGTVSVLGFLGFVATENISFSSFTDMSKKRLLDAREAGGERIHSMTYVFIRLAAFSKFIVYFCLVWTIHRKKSFLSWTGALLAMAIVQTMLLSVLLNSRAGVALLLLDCTVLSYYLSKKVDIKLVGAFFAVAVMLMIPMLAARGQREDRNINSSMNTLLAKTFNGRNMLDISKCCHIINGVPRKMEYRNGEMLYAWLAAPIPTSQWPNKPKWTGQGVVVSQKIFGNKSDINGCPPSLIGELQWNFGWAGIWIGLFMAGLIYRQIFIAFYPHRDNPTCILLYTMIVTRFVIFSLGNDLGTGIVKAGLDLVPVLMVLFFIGMHRPPEIEQQEEIEYESSIEESQPLELV